MFLLNRMTRSDKSVGLLGLLYFICFLCQFHQGCQWVFGDVSWLDNAAPCFIYMWYHTRVLSAKSHWDYDILNIKNVVRQKKGGGGGGNEEGLELVPGYPGWVSKQ